MTRKGRREKPKQTIQSTKKQSNSNGINLEVFDPNIFNAQFTYKRITIVFEPKSEKLEPKKALKEETRELTPKERKLNEIKRIENLCRTLKFSGKNKRNRNKTSQWIDFPKDDKERRDIYEGTIVRGKPHGKGKMLFRDGSIYVGEFKDGSFHGMGTFIDEFQSLKYIGEWFGGEAYGFGRLLYRVDSGSAFPDTNTCNLVFKNLNAPTFHSFLCPGPAYLEEFNGSFKDGKIHGIGYGNFPGIGRRSETSFSRATPVISDFTLDFYPHKQDWLYIAAKTTYIYDFKSQSDNFSVGLTFGIRFIEF